MYLTEIGWEDMDWICLAQDRDQGLALCEHSNEPLDAIIGREFLDQLSDY
jgi:hypothetical protein